MGAPEDGGGGDAPSEGRPNCANRPRASLPLRDRVCVLSVLAAAAAYVAGELAPTLPMFGEWIDEFAIEGTLDGGLRKE